MATLPVLQPNGQIPGPSFEKLPIKASRRRDKPQLSCSLCRRRKLRCDREDPCQNCSKRKCPCIYPSSSEPHPSQSPRSSDRGPTGYPQGFHKQVGELEKLLVSQRNQLNSEGAAWSAIMAKVMELKGNLGNVEALQAASSLEMHEPVVSDLFGRGKSVTKSEILAGLPSKELTEQLMAKCFESLDLTSVIIHQPTFRKEYEKFKSSPSETPVMWIGLLFTMLCVATQYEKFSFNESAAAYHERSPSDSRHAISAYREKTIQCLVLGNYIEAPPYTLEVLLLHLHSKYVMEEDNETERWILLGTISRLAMRMNYHVDGSRLSHLSPFQAEMRRRTWMILRTFDVLYSVHIGLPTIIQDSQCESVAPRNSLDEDLDECMLEVSHPRPDSVQTPVLYFEAKSRITRILGRVLELTNRTPPCSYEDAMLLDKVLLETYQHLPEWLTMRPAGQSSGENPQQMMRRIYTSTLFLKSRCILHRKFMPGALGDVTLNYSRTACIEAAVQLLEIQKELDDEMQIGGCLYLLRRKLDPDLTRNFLLATMILSDFDLVLSPKITSHQDRDAVLKVLNQSYFIWLRASEASKEAQTAADKLRAVLGEAQIADVGGSQVAVGEAAAVFDESILLRPEPVDFMATARHSRGPMLLPPQDHSGYNRAAPERSHE